MKPDWKQIIVAFAVGVMMGIVGTRWCAHCHFHQRRDSGQFQTRLLQRFSSKLHLTSEQQTQVAAILEAKRQKIDTLRAEIRPKFEEIRTATRTEIRQLLIPEQQQKFDVMNAQFEAKRKRFNEHARIK